jgi:pyruvate formate lyase activating enzyme
MFRAARCKLKDGCMRCVNACPQQAISVSGEGDARTIVIDRSKCASCQAFRCAEACYWEALAVCGRRMKVSDLMRVILRDRQYWGSGGGVTLTGGEPLFQREFALEVLKRCREAYIHTGIETSAYVETEFFLEAMALVDWAFVDIKHMDPERHREKTGVRNDLILLNIEALARSGWSGRLIIRIPVIEGFNDDDENLVATAGFLKRLGLREVNVLPFHRLGDSKWTQLGLVYPYRDQAPTSEEKLRDVQRVLRSQGVTCYVDAYTPF